MAILLRSDLGVMDYLSNSVDESEDKAFGLGLKGVLEILDLLFLLIGEGKTGYYEKSEES